MHSEAVIDPPRAATAARAIDPTIPQSRWSVLLTSGHTALGVLLTAGFLIGISAAHTLRLLPDSIRPAPRYLWGALGSGILDLGLGGLIAIMAVMFAAFVGVVRDAHRLPGSLVWSCVVAFSVLMLLAPPLMSTDIFSYSAYGRLGALYHFNPYLYGPSAIALDSFYPFVGWQWVSTPTVYGPLFTAFSYVVAPLDIATSVFVYKAAAELSFLAVVLLVWKAAPLLGLNPTRAVAVVGLNPVCVVYGVGGGHNDMMMVALLIGSVYLMLRRRESAAASFLVLAVAIKLTAGLLLPFAVARRLGGSRGRYGRRATVAAVAAAAALVALFSFLLFGTGTINLLSTLQTVQGRGGINSFDGFILSVLDLSALKGVVGLVLDGALVLWVMWLARRVWRGQTDWLSAAGWATLGTLISAGFLLPWYLVWLAPLSALSPDRRLRVATMVMTGVCLTTL